MLLKKVFVCARHCSCRREMVLHWKYLILLLSHPISILNKPDWRPSRAKTWLNERPKDSRCTHRRSKGEEKTLKPSRNSPFFHIALSAAVCLRKPEEWDHHDLMHRLAMTEKGDSESSCKINTFDEDLIGYRIRIMFLLLKVYLKYTSLSLVPTT